MKRGISLILIVILILSSVSIYGAEPGVRANQVEPGNFKAGTYTFTNGAYSASFAENFNYAVRGIADITSVGYLGKAYGGSKYAVFGFGKSRFDTLTGTYVELAIPAVSGVPAKAIKAIGPASFSDDVDIDGKLTGLDSVQIIHLPFESGLGPALDIIGNETIQGSIKMTGSSPRLIFDNIVIGPSFIRMGTKDQPANIRINGGAICLDDDGSCTPPAAGKVKAIEYLTGQSDLAENINSKEKLSSGDIVIISETNLFVKSTKPYDTRAAGVVSTKPGITLNSEEQGYPLALSGRVPVKVTNENGKIMPGDILTTSSMPGHAMRCDDKLRCYGAVIGKALERSNEKTDVINMLVMLG